jgi:signal transduction histidine kinase
VGNGIAGMRERAAALGGEVEVGSAPGGGFRVFARLSVDR